MDSAASTLPASTLPASTLSGGLGALQRRMWFLEELHGPSGLHHIVVSFSLAGAVDVPALASALAGLAGLTGDAGDADEYAALRQGFCAGPDGPVVVRAEPCPDVPVEVVDLERDGGTWEEVLDRTAWTPFDLASPPLLRAAIVRTAPERIRLVLTVHHLVADGFSLEILMDALSRLYAVHAGIPAPTATDLSLRAPVLIAPRKAHDREEARAFWRERLADVPTILNMPPIGGGGGNPGRAGEGHSFSLDSDIAKRVAELARRQGTTPFVVLLAAYQVLLARWTRQYEFVVGTPISVRGPRDAGDVGLFVETLPLPVQVDRSQPFRELLRSVHQGCATASAWPFVPLEELLDDLSVARHPDHPPLMQTLFSWQGSTMAGPQLDGVEVRTEDVARRWAKFDLTLEVRPGRDGGLDLLFEYATAVVDRATAVSLADAFTVLVADAVTDPDTPVGSLALLPEAHAEHIAEWNRTEAAVPEACLHELIAGQAAATPDAVAIVDGDRILTYAEFDALVGTLAARLREAGAGSGALVAVCLRRSTELVVALTAVLRSGAAYIPLDPDYPEARLAFMLADSGAVLVLTADELIVRIPAASIRTLTVDAADLRASSKTSADMAAPAPAPPPRPDDPAYVIYTSGSTGRPKGAVNAHRGVVNRLLWMREAYGIGTGDAVLQKTSCSFDVSVWELFLPLLSGGRLVLAAPGGERDPAYLARLIEREAVTMVHFVPSMFAEFLQEPEVVRCRSLRTVICSGEALTADLAERARGRLGAGLHNLYGPTEAAIDVTAWDCAEEPGRPLVPIGRPVWNTRLHVLDEEARPVPIGFPGELFIGGVQVGMGYLNRSDLTAERFPVDLEVFPGLREPRCYRTGDLVRWAPEGVLDFLGRLDGQLKIRGFRIESGEVEACLAGFPEVVAAAVAVRGQRLVAYVVAADPARPPSAAELSEYVAASLPAQCVPSAVVVLPRLPLTPNGKLDRSALPDPGPAVRPMVQAPRTDRESAVAAAWAAAIGHDAIGVHDDFFALGGDSILTLKAIGRLRQLGYELSVREFFAAPTVAGQAALLKEHRSADPDPTNPAPAPFALLTPEDRALIPDGVEDAYPLSALQAGMLYESERRLAGSVYHDVLSLRVRTGWDTERFAETLRCATRNHPTLRTSFDFGTFSEPLQLVHRDARVPLRIVDWRHLSEHEQDEQLSLWLRAERLRRIDPATAPLIRVAVHLRAEDVVQVTVSFHHAILDGWSLAVLVTGLLTDTVDAPEFGFASHVELERNAIQDPDTAAFWADYLAGADLSPLPRWDPPRRGAGRSLLRTSVPIPDAMAAGLRRLAGEAGVPIKSVFVEAHVSVLGLLAGREDVTTGLVLHGRPETERGDRVLGLFLTPVPLRRLLTQQSWPDRVRAAFDAEREVLSRRRYPTARLQAERGGTPLFETLVGVNHFHVYDDAMRGGSFELLAVDEAWEETGFALVASFVKTPDGDQRVDLVFDEEVFGRRQIDAVADMYRRVLTAMAGAPPSAVPARTLLGADERRQMSEEWGSGVRPGPTGASIVGLVRAQAAACAEAAAAEYPDGRLTYRELVERAQRWAARLAGAGVRPGDRVATVLPASAELLTVLLGVLMAGAAYVPLDPDHPESRRRAILLDAMPAAVVAERTQHPGIITPLLVPETDVERAAAVPVPLPELDPDPEDIAYLIYTSGSTGRPKGVAVPHRAVVRLVRDPDYVRIDPGDRIGQAATFAFDAAVFEVWGALANGGTVVGLERSAVLDADALAAAVADRRIDIMFLTTAVVHETARRRPDAFGSMKTLLFGGETADPVAIRTLLEAARPERLVHVYGPTETGVFAVWHEVESVPRGAGSVPIGRPIANTDVLVVDRDGELVPPGAPGELLIGGPGLAAGYFGLPDLTAERFVPHPLDPARTVYRTGDIVRWDAGPTADAGRLEFIGRRDDQVKIRGFRVEPAEIESVIKALPGVEDAVVVVRRSADGTPTLVGYVCGSALQAVELLEAAAVELPRPMVPAAIVTLAKLPLNANGKVDRAALPEPDTAVRDRRYVAPENDDERRVAAAWAKVLRIDAGTVGATDDFFDAGGHSLLLAQLAGRLEADWGVRLPLEELSVHSTVRAQALRLRRSASGNGVGPAVRGVVELRPGSSDLAPLILVHPVGGTCTIYVSLARALDDGRPVLGLQAPGVDGDGPVLDTVPALAEHHLAGLRAAGVRGPYLLGGMSMGGTIAFEMARQLAAAGEPPALVALLDSPGPGQMPRRFADDAEVLAAAFTAEGDGMAERLRALGPEEMMRYVLAQARAGGAVPDDFELVDLGVFLRVWKAHTTALYSYVPKPYPGPVHYFRAQDTVPPHPAHPERPWQALLGRDLEVIPVPGDHQSMVEPPHVATLADLLIRAIRRVVASSTSDAIHTQYGESR